jgi:CheY-like chemotaxis protein
MTVLLVDDDDDVRTIARLSLTNVGGLRVVEARTGAEALDAARRESPDVILLDVMMPEMDGPETLRALRADAATASIPVVFLTANAIQSEMDQLAQLGVAAVLTKPFDPMTLASRVSAITSAQTPSVASRPSHSCS